MPVAIGLFNLTALAFIVRLVTQSREVGFALLEISLGTFRDSTADLRLVPPSGYAERISSRELVSTVMSYRADTKTSPSESMEDTREETSKLIHTFLETESRLMEVTRGEVDSIFDSGGRSYLLQDGQEQLRQSEEQFRCMFNAAATGIATFTQQGHYLQANAASCRMLGYIRDSTLDFSWLNHHVDLTLSLKLREELTAAQLKSLVIEEPYFRKNGDAL